ncbi:elongation factor P [Candidatus Parcubacteria bacterium]|uniref:Elongation factor P n=1 Tax=Candidatus Kaiserbacteria bacterium CG10_big_fil_rev_8_21_14_0_10_47_16 TaxID=1974608 RepID=A0A2H0UGA7_9BACT|nr:elongation factor P [Candidatus Parcubacteria bacterium]PIR84835.1 MAG: elongation factor P [Candidatus Kaiserbacteria bacterium CG10_big_fil_rev_8_21_14_0_10_47_16]
MAVLAYNEITLKKFIVFNNEPCLVVASHVFRKQQRKPVNITKLKGFVSGRTYEQTFHQNETANEADLERTTIEYIYENRGEYWFCPIGKPAERFALSPELVGDQGHFLKPKSEIEALVYDEKIIGVTIPIKVDLVVKHADPAVKGNTSSSATKEVTLETGAHIHVPMFINEGDVIRVNTELGEYTERVDKA